jgi:hypothetical protein
MRGLCYNSLKGTVKMQIRGMNKRQWSHKVYVIVSDWIEIILYSEPAKKLLPFYIRGKRRDLMFIKILTAR